MSVKLFTAASEQGARRKAAQYLRAAGFTYDRTARSWLLAGERAMFQIEHAEVRSDPPLGGVAVAFVHRRTGALL